MKSKKRVATIVVLALVGVALVAVPSAAMRGRGGAGGTGRAAGRGMGPAFTESQLEQIEKIHEKYNDERAELTNRLKVIMVEAHENMGEGEPDFDAIEDTMEEVADIKLKLAKMRLQIHKEIRPLLDDDQKVLFDRKLGRMLHGGRGHHPGMMGSNGMRDGSRGGRGMRHPGMMGGMGGPCMQGGAGMQGGPGMQKGPGAMWWDDAPDAEDE